MSDIVTKQARAPLSLAVVIGGKLAGPPTPTKILKADGASAEASANKVFDSDQSEVWLTYDLYYSSLSFVGWLGDEYGPAFSDLVRADTHRMAYVWLMWDSGSSGLFYTLYLEGTSQNESASGALADNWQTIEMHYSSGNQGHLYIDGSLLVTTGVGSSDLINSIKVGCIQGDLLVNDQVYIRNVKVGTTRGASDLFADDFSSGDLSNWSSTSGSVSVVDDPF
jgi:hypothetical protein